MNENQVVVREARPLAELPTWTREQVDLIKNTVARGTSDDELKLFLETCRVRRLNPLLRQIYAIMRRQMVDGQWKQVMTIQTSIDGFRLNAERSGHYAGQLGPFFSEDGEKWTDCWIKSTPPKVAKVGILRHDFKEPLWAMARFDAYCPRDNSGHPTGLWGKMPDGQIAKCAEALGLRRAFPEENGGLYIAEEMDQANVQVEAAPVQRPAPKLAVKPMPPRIEPPKPAPKAPEPVIDAEYPEVGEEQADAPPTEAEPAAPATVQLATEGQINLLLTAIRTAGIEELAAIERVCAAFGWPYEVDQDQTLLANLRMVLGRVPREKVNGLKRAIDKSAAGQPQGE